MTKEQAAIVLRLTNKESEVIHQQIEEIENGIAFYEKRIFELKRDLEEPKAAYKKLCDLSNEALKVSLQQ